MKIARIAAAAARIYLHGRARRHAIDLSRPGYAHCKTCGRYWWAL